MQIIFKTAALTIGLSALMNTVQAQHVSLTDSELKTLKGAVQADDKVRKEFEGYKTIAEKALNEAPNPIEKVTSQGLLQGNPAKTASLKAVEDATKIYALALNYRLYGESKYLKKTTEYLTAWARINHPTGDPIDESKLEDMFVGYDLIRNKVDKPLRQQIDKWMESIVHAEIHSFAATPNRSTAKNNWNSHRIKIITQAAYAIHADKYRDTIIMELEKQIAQNLYADGSGYDFEERDALHYHIFSLEPLLKAMIVLNRAEGKNYYQFESPTTSSVEKSVQFLVPFVTGEKTHGEFAKSKVKFDRDRAANGEKGYIAGAPFKPRNGIVVLSLASYFNSSLLKVIQQVAGQQYYDWQLVLNRVRKPVK